MSHNLQVNIFYLISEILAEVNKKKFDITNKYSSQFHQNNLDFFQDTLNKKIENFCRKNKDIDPSFIKELSFCIICLIDDLFIAIDNEIKKYWTVENLENRIYKTQSGGDVFFSNLLKHMTEKNTEKNSLLFTYYICIKSGFKGNLSNDLTKLKQIESRLYTLIELEEEVILPVIEKEGTWKEPSSFSKLKLKLNHKFIKINLAIFLIFLIVNSLIWYSKSLSILNLFN